MRDTLSSLIQTELSVMESHHISPGFAGVADFYRRSGIQAENTPCGIDYKHLSLNTLRSFELRHRLACSQSAMADVLFPALNLAPKILKTISIQRTYNIAVRNLYNELFRNMIKNMGL